MPAFEFFGSKGEALRLTVKINSSNYSLPGKREGWGGDGVDSMITVYCQEKPIPLLTSPLKGEELIFDAVRLMYHIRGAMRLNCIPTQRVERGCLFFIAG